MGHPGVWFAAVSEVGHALQPGDEWDVSISHASEDKDAIARPLVEAPRAKGLRVWYDEFSLKVGDSLRKKIDHGLQIQSLKPRGAVSPYSFTPNCQNKNE